MSISGDGDLPIGPFSGVNLLCLLKKTTLESEPALAAEGRELESFGTGMRIERRSVKVNHPPMRKDLRGKHPRISKRAMATATGISTTSIDKNLAILKSKGFLQPVGSARSGHGELVAGSKPARGRE